MFRPDPPSWWEDCSLANCLQVSGQQRVCWWLGKWILLRDKRLQSGRTLRNPHWCSCTLLQRSVARCRHPGGSSGGSWSQGVHQGKSWHRPRHHVDCPRSSGLGGGEWQNSWQKRGFGSYRTRQTVWRQEQILWQTWGTWPGGDRHRTSSLSWSVSRGGGLACGEQGHCGAGYRYSQYWQGTVQNIWNTSGI